MLALACRGNKEAKKDPTNESPIAATDDAGKARLVTGDEVFVRSVGLGRVTGFAMKGPDGQAAEIHSPQEPRDFYVVESQYRTTYVTIDNDLLRPLISPTTATAILETLRGSAPKSNPEDTANMVTARSMEVIQHGTPEQAASFLRAMYALSRARRSPRHGASYIRNVGRRRSCARSTTRSRNNRRRNAPALPAFDRLAAANQAKGGTIKDIPNTVKVPISSRQPPKPVGE
jgi:hypothetical protein